MNSHTNIQNAPVTGVENAHGWRFGIAQRTERVLSRAVKRCFDVFAATFLLVILLPMLAVVSLLVAMDGGPVFFSHKRVGRNGKIFGCLKFRSMIPDAEDTLREYLALHPEAAEEWEKTRKLSFDPRITTVGRALRSSSIDELPQLINVIKGDMSLVGPRPITSQELDRYGVRADYYKAVRPGITGLWQVNGRNDLSYEQRMAMDVEYVKNWSLFADAGILLRTPRVVLSRDGAR